MVQHCCVPCCSAKGVFYKGQRISYYDIPVEKSRRNIWIQAIRRDENTSFVVKRGQTKVCSLHFTSDDFNISLGGRRYLLPTSVPSKFQWNADKTTRKPPTPRSACMAKPTAQLTSTITIQSPVYPTTEPEAVSLDAGCFTSNISHQSCQTNPCTDLARIAELEQELEIMKSAINESKKREFCLSNVKESDKDILHYTGFPSYEVMMCFLDYLDPGPKGENIRYYSTDLGDVSNEHYMDKDQDVTKNNTKQGRRRTLPPAEEYFLVLCRIRQNFSEQHLSKLFGISQPSVSRILITWINYMYLKCSQINIWPTREQVDEFMPEDFKQKYPQTRVIIDCTEVKCQMPSSLLLNSEMFSSYKNHVTLKGLIGISPGGSVTFISELYTGLISDMEITDRSGFVNLAFEVGDSVMADKGFLIDDLLPAGVALNLPPFLGSQGQMSPSEVIRTQNIASLRIHVERAINKIKNFHIWDGIVPLSLFGVINQMWSVCAFLTNIQNPIISG